MKGSVEREMEESRSRRSNSEEYWWDVEASGRKAEEQLRKIHEEDPRLKREVQESKVQG